MADALSAQKVVAFPEAGSRPKLLDRVRHAIRTRHYSRRTEQAYVDWIRRYIVFHSPRDEPWRPGREEPDGSAVSGYARAWRVSSGAPIALPAWKLMPMNGFVATAFLVHSWIRAGISAYPSRSAIGGRFCDHLRAYPRREAARFLLESPSIPGDCDGNDCIRMVWDTRRFAAH